MTQNCETGRVKKIDDQFIEIEMESKAEECHKCSMSFLCGMGPGERIAKFPHSEINVPLRVGQRVEIRFERIIGTSFLLYIFPLILFIGGLLVARYCFGIQNELKLFGIGVAGLFVAFAIVRLLSQRLSKKNYRIKINPI